MITAGARLKTDAGQQVGLKVLYNGITPIAWQNYYALGTATRLNVNTLYYLSAGDFVNVTGYSESASPKAYYVSLYSPVFAMQRVG
jgi:hypothetical protein